MSSALKGEKHPMYGVHRLGEEAPHYGKPHTEETKAKMSAAKKGKKASNEAKEKMSQRAKERMQIISDAYKKYKLDGGMLTWYDFIKQYSKSIQ